MFRFTIRDVLWLMVVVGLAVGWWVQQRALFEETVRLKNANEGLHLQADEKKSTLQNLARQCEGEVAVRIIRTDEGKVFVVGSKGVIFRYRVED